jgi:hypothetical protein
VGLGWGGVERVSCPHNEVVYISCRARVPSTSATLHVAAFTRRRHLVNPAHCMCDLTEGVSTMTCACMCLHVPTNEWGCRLPPAVAGAAVGCVCRYPKYYADNTFHYQTDGWLSSQ